MKVRIIKQPQFTHVHTVQVKTWWWPFWKDVADEDLPSCEKIVENIVAHGAAYDLIKEVEIK